MNNFFSLLLSVFISVIVAILSFYCMDNVSIMNSIFFGLLSFFIMHVIITSVNSEKLSKDITEIKAKLTAEQLVKSENNFDYYWMSCIEKARKGTYTFISENCIKIPQPEFRRFWHRAVANADKKWECTHYVKAHQDTDYSIEEGFKTQGYLNKVFGLHVKRLFIFDKKEEISKDELNHIREQHDIGIETKIFISGNKRSYDKYLDDKIGTIDMAIVNEAYLMSFVLKKNTVSRKKQWSLDYVKFSSEQEEINIVSKIYGNMWHDSYEIEEIEKELEINNHYETDDKK